MVRIYTGLERRRLQISLANECTPRMHPYASPGRHKPLSLPRYLFAGLTYLNNLFLQKVISAYDSFLNISNHCREQLTT